MLLNIVCPLTSLRRSICLANGLTSRGMIARLALPGAPKTLNCSCADTRYRQTVRINALDIGLYRLTIPSGGGPLKGDRPDRPLHCDAINHGGDNGGFSLQGRRSR